MQMLESEGQSPKISTIHSDSRESNGIITLLCVFIQRRLMIHQAVSCSIITGIRGVLSTVVTNGHKHICLD